MKKTLAKLREEAKHYGLTGYSRATKAALEEALGLVVVYRQDPLVRQLGEDLLRKCSVQDWYEKITKTGEYRKAAPWSWCVPRGLLGGKTPISQVDAVAIFGRRLLAGRKAAKTAKANVRRQCAERLSDLRVSEARHQQCAEAYRQQCAERLLASRVADAGPATERD